ncbi:MAG: 23S rRNA (pseudouridine(1915)-N(3))-methyltransferase RlmH, partial [Thermodesulfovibrio sp.]|nr:23S rRNA (pseudouridine(1915)-N(3))-methyltransferase RlmH [Thermodesulfovibrio sp.]
MYRIKIYQPGKIKEKFIKEGLAHYLKIINPFAKVESIELKEGHGEIQKVIEEESKNIINAVKGEFILLHREGTMLDSLQFAKLIG